MTSLRAAFTERQVPPPCLRLGWDEAGKFSDRTLNYWRTTILAIVIVGQHGMAVLEPHGSEVKAIHRMADPVEEVVTLAVGDERRIALPGRGSAGLTWSVSLTGDTDVVGIARTAGERPTLPPAGGPPPNSFSLDEVLVITGRRVGSTLLVGELKRPGGPERTPVARRLIRLEVVAAEPDR